MTAHIRQAVVVIHGMGEQLPLTTLTGFIDTALQPGQDGQRVYYSRPESVTGSYESRRFLAPRLVDVANLELHAQTDFFEYHWADKMEGNRLDDLWPTFRRMMLQFPTRVPRGLKGFWLLGWALIISMVWASVWGPWAGKIIGQENPVTALVNVLVSGGLTAAVLSYVFSRLLPGWLTGSFVDVVRYLDTSPRSYAVRREIRKGLVDMLQALHDSRRPRYDRVVLVAHSLGAFIAYDAVAYLWGENNAKTRGSGTGEDLMGLRELEEAASRLPDQTPARAEDVATYQDAQRLLWRGIRAQGNPWLITDLVSVGTPMYFADQLMPGKDGRSFERRIARRELPTCPPQNEEADYNNIYGNRRFYSWLKRSRTGAKGQRVDQRHRVIYEGAPFAVVRWTNLYFPVKFGLFGDWFGGPLAPLFGTGIRDIRITGNTVGRPGTTWWRNRLVPAAAHTYYFDFPDDDANDSTATALRDALALDSSAWASGLHRLKRPGRATRAQRVVRQ